MCLYERQGAALTNFGTALAPLDAERALSAVKDPYVFEFLDLAEDICERQLEQALIDDVQSFLLELGSGFAFYGRQHSLLLGGQEFFLDLLFYHHALRRFVVIELKVGEFQAEYLGKMNLYLNAVDEQLRRGDDRESVGILCTKRNETIAKLALRRTQAPIAVSTWHGAGSRTAPITGESHDEHAEAAQLDHLGARLAELVSRRTASLSGSGVALSEGPRQSH